MAVISAWPLPEGIKSVEVNGYPMAYQESGSGTPLVLVHGSMNDYRCWNLQIPAFTAHYRVLAVSLRHYFPEPWDGQGDDFSIPQHADRPEARPSLSCETIGKFRFPNLMLTGETSPDRFGQMLRAMRDCLPGSVGEPTIIPNAAHGMNRDNPKAFNAAVLAHLQHYALTHMY
jgi:pimeloyl-ACP methyl ester carboxylesterase